MEHAGGGRAVRWAARTGFGEQTNALSGAIDEARRASLDLIDLTVSNPTRCGFAYDAEAILGPLSLPASLVYEADPMGMRLAREAIAAVYYGGRGVPVDPDRMMLTSSTSEAYGYLLRLLCDVGDEVLVPRPSYPLFDLLARMHDVRLVEYPLLLHDGWRVDVEQLRRRISPRTRAIVVVHPNNPTGHAIEVAERGMLYDLACEFGLALIVDEVFLDYPVEREGTVPSFAGGDAPALTFVLSGLSKVLALPQMKLAWTVVRGPAGVCENALRRLEFIADTFLSLNAPVQHALRPWLELAGPMRTQILNRTRANLATLDAMFGGTSVCGRLRVAAGWSVVLRVPAVMADEELAVRLATGGGVVVHPGSFYGLPESGWLVTGLLLQTDRFQRGVGRLLREVDRVVTGEPER